MFIDKIITYLGKYFGTYIPVVCRTVYLKIQTIKNLILYICYFTIVISIIIYYKLY